MRPIAPTTALLLLSASACAPQADNAATDDIDAVFAEFDRVTGPGCAVGVVEEGRLTFNRGYGSGNLDHGIALDGSSVFYLASVSKQFAAASILIAAQEGLLTLDDEIGRHIPEFPDYGQPITIRHLVHHTSGVRDYLALMSLKGVPFENILSDEEMYGLIFRQEALNFTPGSEYLYSNSGYILLAEIVNRATGRSLREYAAEKIFEPLGMSDTHFHDDRSHVVPRRVLSYDAREDGQWATNYLLNFDKVGDGGLYSTVEDLARWDAAFYDGLPGLPDFAQQMYEHEPLNDGGPNTYAFGLQVDTRRGFQRVAHGGSLMAFRTSIARYPELQTTVIVLCNVGTANSGALSTAVEDIVLADRLAEEDRAGAPESVSVGPAVLAEYEGDFLVRPGFVLSIRREEDRLLGRATGQGETELVASSDSTFFVPAAGATVTFHRGADGSVDALTLDQNGSTRAARVEAWMPSREHLSAVVGRYYSPDLDVVFTVSAEAGSLTLQRPRGEPTDLNPAPGGEVLSFISERLGSVTFSTGATGEVTHMSMSNSRARNLRFVRRVGR